MFKQKLSNLHDVMEEKSVGVKDLSELKMPVALMICTRSINLLILKRDRKIRVFRGLLCQLRKHLQSEFLGLYAGEFIHIFIPEGDTAVNQRGDAVTFRYFLRVSLASEVSLVALQAIG